MLIVTPDKDLCQCVRGTRVVEFDRRKREIIDEAAVVEKFGVGPASIPDYLGLVGDTADGFPGLPGWGAKSAAMVLARYGHIEDIPRSVGDWDVPGLRGGEKLAVTLRDQFELALLFRRIATVELDVEVGNGRRLVVDRSDTAVRRDRPPARRSRTGRTIRAGGRPRRRQSRRLRWRPGDLRHTSDADEGCYLPVLTWFTGAHCTGPGRHLTRRGLPVRSRQLRQTTRPVPCEHPSRWLSLDGSSRWVDGTCLTLIAWRDARAAESARLESVCGETHRGFESHSLRHGELRARAAASATPASHAAWMQVALDEARAALEHGDVPVGAVVIRDGDVLAAATQRARAHRRSHRARRDPGAA